MTTLAEYRSLVMQHAEARALGIRLNGTGVTSDSDVAARADGVIICAMREADEADTLTSAEIEILARSLRFSLGELTAMPQESLADTLARYREAALRLRRMVDEGE